MHRRYLSEGPTGPSEHFPLSKWRKAATDCIEQVQESLDWAFNPTHIEPQSDDSTKGIFLVQQSLYKYICVLRDIVCNLDSDRWHLANAKSVLIYGEAGTGKSHLLADIVEYQIHENYPALLLLGNQFIDSEIWPQIRTQLDRPSNEQIKHFLANLNTTAQIRGVRAILCIDALNERHGTDIWPTKLASFLQTFEQFPYIAVIVSCRSTYVDYIIPKDLPEDKLFRIEHQGFAHNGGDAIKDYLIKRQISHVTTPQPIREFENPLFLKIYCDFLDKKGESEIPKGFSGISSLFDVYKKTLVDSVNTRLQLDAHIGIVPKAIDKFVRLILENDDPGRVEKYSVIEAFEAISPSGGSREKSLLSQLEHEGFLTVEPLRQKDGSHIEVVRFTFERFSDHLIADKLLRDNIISGDVIGSFHPGKPLYQFIFSQREYQRAGVIEAIAIQLPEKFGIEILDIPYEGSWVMNSAFQNSLLWRKQSNFTDRTLAIAQELLDPDELKDLLVSISTEPTNKFNADFLHAHLIKMTMPERDGQYSIYLTTRGFDNYPVKALISWAVRSDLDYIDGEHARLASKMLTWFLTTSHREVRDKATKALACIFSRNLQLATRLLHDFSQVNDVYVLERLLAACYGAALQGIDNEGLKNLAQTTFDLIFANREPPVNILLRDHAQGILDYAKYKGVLDPSIDLIDIHPPYSSPWPIEPVSDELIDSYRIEINGSSYQDEIVSSTLDDCGDFARYVVHYKLIRWSPAKIGTNPLPTTDTEDIYNDWRAEFLVAATTKQQQALDAYIAIVEKFRQTQDNQFNSESEQLKLAEMTLQQSMTLNEWKDFRVRARDFILRQKILENDRDQPAIFNISWGCRWICKRAHELGWTAKRFGNHDRHCVSHDQFEHRTERIGKKYQWIALHELEARMVDNLAYLGDYWARSGADVPTMYRLSDQVENRDIDPSFLTTNTYYDGWRTWDETWWVPFSPQLRSMGPLECLSWLDSDEDIVNDRSLIEIKEPRTNRNWLALSGFSSWGGRRLANHTTGMRKRKTWYRLTCIVVSKNDQAKMLKSLNKKILTSPHLLPETIFSGYYYLGEYPWHSETQGDDQHELKSLGSPLANVPVYTTFASYTTDRSSYDYSVDSTMELMIPAPWMMRKMDLHLREWTTSCVSQFRKSSSIL